MDPKLSAFLAVPPKVGEITLRTLSIGIMLLGRQLEVVFFDPAQFAGAARMRLELDAAILAYLLTESTQEELCRDVAHGREWFVANRVQPWMFNASATLLKTVLDYVAATDEAAGSMAVTVAPKPATEGESAPPKS